MVDKTNSGLIINQYSYTYDVNGDIITETDSNCSTISTMTYDANGRLTARKDNDILGNEIANYTYSYDAASNITVSSRGTLVYDTNNRLISNNGQNMTYDADGNMTTGMLNGTTATFSYDSGNRLIQVGSTKYTYDANNNRMTSTTDNKTTKYVYDTTADLSRMLMSTNADGITIYYVYGNGLISSEVKMEIIVFTIMITVAAHRQLQVQGGTVTERYSYDAYGKLLTHTGTGITPFLFNGHDGVITDSNGLYYMQARYYSPEIGRFVNADVRKGSISNSNTLNRYAFANGNPVSFVDPRGEFA